MDRLDAMLVKGSIKARKAAEKIFAKEHGDSNIVTILVLCVVAVGLCILYRNGIKDVIETTVATVTTKISELVNITVDPFA